MKAANTYTVLHTHVHVAVDFVILWTENEFADVKRSIKIVLFAHEE